MKVEFRDPGLEAIVRSGSGGGARLHPDVLRAAHKKLVMLESAADERDLRNFKSFHYEKLVGDRAGQRSVRVNDQYRFVFELDDTTKPPTINILDLIDYH